MYVCLSSVEAELLVAVVHGERKFLLMDVASHSSLYN
jgi:hypothetical protein